MKILELISKLEVIYSQKGNIEATLMSNTCVDYFPQQITHIQAVCPHGQDYVLIWGEE